MNRIDRVTAILIHLQSRKVVKAQDIAERFNISLRTVYRDINTLEEAGIPIIGEAGVGYSIMDGYKLPPVMFTIEEATAFLTAEKLIEKLTDEATEHSYKSAMYKIRAVLRSTEKSMIENIEDHIEVLSNPSRVNHSPGSNTLQPILKSIAQQKVLHIHYAALSATEITKRNIEPIGIFFVSGYWHTIAFCQLRNDYRDFRTDRIQQITATDQSYSATHPSLKTYLKQLAREQHLETLVVNIRKQTARYLNETKYYYGFVKEEMMQDHVQMTFLTAMPDAFIRWYSMFADHAEIVSPASLHQLLKAHIDKIAQKIPSSF